ncbi:MAG: hypothetical protein LBP61_09195 [Desulfovibrio sp.]|jgi:hypothetical protein|nr:hypothetical protein [Desulfovibrio sp.]
MFQALGWRGQLGAVFRALLMLYVQAAITLALLATLLAVTPGAVFLVMAVIAGFAAGTYKAVKAKPTPPGQERPNTAARKTRFP